MDSLQSKKITEQLPLSFLVKQLRQKRRETVAEFAAVIGVHRNTVYCWENGKLEPRYENFLVLKQAAAQINFDLGLIKI